MDYYPSRFEIIAVTLLTWGIMAGIFLTPIYLVSRKIKLKRWYLPWRWITHLLKRYEGEFGPVVFIGHKSTVQYQIVGIFGSVFDAWMCHKGEEQKINSQLQILLSPASRANLYEQAKALNIEIVTYCLPDGTAVLPPTAQAAQSASAPQQERGVIIGE